MSKKIKGILLLLCSTIILFGCDKAYVKEIEISSANSVVGDVESNVLDVKKGLEHKELLCDRTQARPFGSIRVQIYSNGDVYSDEEIEEPNHKWKMEYYKTLCDEDLEEVKELIESENDSELSKYIDKLIK